MSRRTVDKLILDCGVVRDWADRVTLLIYDMEEALEAKITGGPSGIRASDFLEDLQDLQEDMLKELQ